MKKCKTCRNDFEPSNKFKNYCSNRCKFSRPQSEESKLKLREATLNAARAKGIVPRKERLLECHQCKETYHPKWDTPSKPSRFCSRSCGNVYRFSQEGAREKQAQKVGEWIDKHPTLKRRVRGVKRVPRFTKERKPRVKKVRVCRSCDCSIMDRNRGVTHCADCRKFSQYVPMFTKLEVNIHKNLQINAELAKDKLVKFYHEMNMSMLDIQRDYKINVNTLHRFAKRKNFKLRTISEGCKMAFQEGRNSPSVNIHSTFKQGWHTTWEGNRFYYRSSYEYDVCKELDEKMVSYSMESLRIPYFDSQKQKTRTALPDFHLPVHNEIVEVKSEYFFDKVNMQDKFREYKSRGYDCRLLLEHKEYSYEEVLSM